MAQRVRPGTPDTLATVLQMLQRLCGRVQEEVRALRLCPLEPVQDELLYARDLIKDAKNSRAVSPPQPHPSLRSGKPRRLSCRAGVFKHCPTHVSS